MSTPGPSQARNAIKKSPFGLLGKGLRPKDQDAIWAFFESSCAYCGTPLNRKLREGDIDHLIALSAGGRDCIVNCVLACKICNGDEKLEMDWQRFIEKHPRNRANAQAGRKRAQKIRDWIDAQQDTTLILDETLKREVEQEVKRALSAYRSAELRIKALRLGD